jgi:NAD(P)H-flavin reductase
LAQNLIPRIVRIAEVRDETPEIKTLRLELTEPCLAEGLSFRPGQFCMISVLGSGEAAFSIASPPAWEGFFEITVKQTGKVTADLHDVEPAGVLGFRGPYGNGFPYEDLFGRDICFVGGGIGLAPLRPMIWQMLLERERFGGIRIVYGARCVSDLVYKEDLKAWAGRDDVSLVTTVDPGGEDKEWTGEVGLVPDILEKVDPPNDSVMITCGPPVMIRFVLATARKLGFQPRDVITTLEMKMKCGVGTCGRCNIGNLYVCKDGPVFTLEQLQALPDEV